ncbi:MAG: acetate--CoA ligase family protein [Thermodesulfobacteriota bacterium]
MDKDAIKTLKEKGRKNLTEPETMEILASMGIALPKRLVVKSVEEAMNSASGIGYPLVLKVVSADIVHKTEAGGVATGLKDTAELESAWMEMLWHIADDVPGANIEGFIIEEMLPPGAVEVIVGSLKDNQFGPAVMFGMGGIMVEATRDFSFRLAPVTKEEAMEMVTEIKAYAFLDGSRGKRFDIDGIAEVIFKMSRIISEFDFIAEIEINPLFVYQNSVVAADARAVLV